MKLNSRLVRNGLLWLVVIVLALMVLFNIVQGPDSKASFVPLSAMAQEIKDGNVTKILIQENQLRITRRSGPEVLSRKEDSIGLIDELKNFDITTGSAF